MPVNPKKSKPKPKAKRGDSNIPPTPQSRKGAKGDSVPLNIKSKRSTRGLHPLPTPNHERGHRGALPPYLLIETQIPYVSI